MSRHDANRRTQSGQALVEFLVGAMFFLLPCFLAIAVVGKFIDVQHTTDMAARYAAWERTVWYDDDPGSKFYKHNHANQKSAAAIRNEMNVRILNDHSSAGTVIRHTDMAATSFVNGLDPLWRDPQGSVYLDQYAQASSSVGRETPQRDVAGAALKLLGALPVPQIVGTLAPPVPGETLAVARVGFDKVGRNSGVYARLWSTPAWTGLDFDATGAILSNTWYANSSAGTKAMVEESVPTANALGDFINAAAIVGIGPWDPSIPGRIEMGKVAVDQVPPDRLK